MKSIVTASLTSLSDNLLIDGCLSFFHFWALRLPRRKSAEGINCGGSIVWRWEAQKRIRNPNWDDIAKNPVKWKEVEMLGRLKLVALMDWIKKSDRNMITFQKNHK